MDDKKLGKMPLDGLRKLFEGTGYEVISITPEREGLKFSGFISVLIAPESYLEQSDYFNFPQIGKDCGCTYQSPQQGEGNSLE